MVRRHEGGEGEVKAAQQARKGSNAQETRLEEAEIGEAEDLPSPAFLDIGMAVFLNLALAWGEGRTSDSEFPSADELSF
jgi:hypothetical protein